MPNHQPPLACARCSTELKPGQGNLYVVRIIAVADPFPLVLTDDDLARDTEREIQDLLAKIRGTSEHDLMDQVYRSKVFSLCGPCYHRWIENPIGDKE